MRLLSVQADAKTRKGNKLGVLTGILYLTPADGSGRNVCPDASPGCIASCLNTAGRGVMDSVQRGRARKTELFFTDRAAFMEQLCADIRALVRKARRENMVPAVRLNGTSDLPWERIKVHPFAHEAILELFPDVQFYDYTKSERRALAWAHGKMPSNYDLTFSRSECNDDACKRVLAAGGRIAAVFGRVIPAGYRLQLFGRPCTVVDGDETDVRFYDPRGVIVALQAKGAARKDTSGFVVRF
jgi:hypothetical protein